MRSRDSACSKYRRPRSLLEKRGKSKGEIQVKRKVKQNKENRRGDEEKIPQKERGNEVEKKGLTE